MEQEVVKLVSPYAVAYRLRIPCRAETFVCPGQVHPGRRPAVSRRRQIPPDRRRRSGYRTNPFLLPLWRGVVFVEIAARPGEAVESRPREDDLEELKRSDTKCGCGAGQVQPPGSDKSLVEHAGDLTSGLLEPLQPVFQSARVVQAQVLHVENGET